MCEKKWIIAFFILTITKIEIIYASTSSTSTCDIKNNNNKTFQDLWGYKHNWLDPEDGWDENQRNLFISRQKQGIYQTKHIPKYTKHGYKKMDMPPKLYKLIYDLRNSSVFEPEICVESQLSNCNRKKKDGTKGIIIISI